MNFPGIIYGDPKVHAITAEGIRQGKVLTGYYAAPGDLKGLNAFIASGITACHESTQANEALEKASRGMYVQQRYGTAWLDLPNLVPDTRMFTMVTDDESMALTANILRETGGGIAVVQDDGILARMPLPFGGLMSLKSVEDAAQEIEHVEEALKSAGCPHDSVEMTISLLGLIVLGELHLSNRGLVEFKDGKPPRFVDLIC